METDCVAFVTVRTAAATTQNRVKHIPARTQKLRKQRINIINSVTSTGFMFFLFCVGFSVVFPFFLFRHYAHISRDADSIPSTFALALGVERTKITHDARVILSAENLELQATFAPVPGSQEEVETAAQSQQQNRTDTISEAARSAMTYVKVSLLFITSSRFKCLACMKHEWYYTAQNLGVQVFRMCIIVLWLAAVCWKY